MPLSFLQEIDKSHTIVAAWHITESERELMVQINPNLQPDDKPNQDVSPNKKLEWYALRILLQRALNVQNIPLVTKDQFGKPHIDNYHMSLSHSADYLAIIISPHYSVGIDIQYFTPKILRIQSRFLNLDEIACLTAENTIEQLHVFWGAKESLYKAYGKRELDFRRHINIAPFTYQLQGDCIQGTIHKNDYQKKYKIHYSAIKNFSLVYAIQH